MNDLNKIVHYILEIVYEQICNHMLTHIYKIEDYIELKRLAKSVLSVINCNSQDKLKDLLLSGYFNIKFSDTNNIITKIIDIFSKEFYDYNDIKYMIDQVNTSRKKIQTSQTVHKLKFQKLKQYAKYMLCKIYQVLE